MKKQQQLHSNNMASPQISVDVLELNVSGVTEGFTLRRQLLCSVPGSALEAMFSERND